MCSFDDGSHSQAHKLALPNKRPSRGCVFLGTKMNYVITFFLQLSVLYYFRGWVELIQPDACANVVLLFPGRS